MPILSRAAADSGEPDRRAQIRLGADARSGAIARAFVTEACHEWDAPDVLDDAALVATELVENAVRHARTACELTMELTDRELVISVSDGSLLLPRQAVPSLIRPGGRGLLLVDELSLRWGFEVHDEGKTVQAVLPRVPYDGGRVL